MATIDIKLSPRGAAKVTWMNTAKSKVLPKVGNGKVGRRKIHVPSKLLRVIVHAQTERAYGTCMVHHESLACPRIGDLSSNDILGPNTRHDKIPRVATKAVSDHRTSVKSGEAS